MHSGVGGLAYVLAEIRLNRPWTEQESSVAEAVAGRLTRQIPDDEDATFFDGLPSSLGVLIALRAPGAEAAIARLADLATSDGWPQTVLGPPRYLEGTRISDATLGPAGVLLAALWAHRHGVAGAREVAEQAADVLTRDAEHLPTASE